MKIIYTLLLIFATHLAHGGTGTPLYAQGGLTIYQTSATYNGVDIYNAEKEKRIFKKKEWLRKGFTTGVEAKVDPCPSTVDITFNPLSLVSRYYSYEHFFGSEEACGRYGNTIKVETVDLTTKKK